ncbi:hypothetical protein BLOT_016103 [Blomia tropicalis]|nr:hypothetical protein BLOT_016103 [Blomia tropicalis]
MNELKVTPHHFKLINHNLQYFDDIIRGRAVCVEQWRVMIVGDSLNMDLRKDLSSVNLFDANLNTKKRCHLVYKYEHMLSLKDGKPSNVLTHINLPHLKTFQRRASI